MPPTPLKVGYSGQLHGPDIVLFLILSPVALAAGFPFSKFVASVLKICGALVVVVTYIMLGISVPITLTGFGRSTPDAQK
jgi:hypothetical protein